MPHRESGQAWVHWIGGASHLGRESYDKIDAATTETADLIKNSYSKAVKGMQDYNNKIIEFAHANTNAAFDFVQKLSGVKSPPAFVELWTEHARDADRADQATCGARPEGDARDRGAPQDGRRRSV
jgi:hypothetical protein